MYSSTSDLLALGRAILDSKLLPPDTTRAWLQPHAHTSSLGLSVGAPWEILRAETGTPNNHVVDFYTKGGTFNEYHSLLVLVPDYDLVLTLLTAGPDATRSTTLTLSSQIFSAILPAFEITAKAEALQTYAGTYTSMSDTKEGTIILSVDEGPGLAILNWTSKNLDMLALYSLFFFPTDSNTPLSSRLYPTNIANASVASWRAVLQPKPAPNDSNPPLIYHNMECVSWMRLDGYPYGHNGIDDFVFHKDANTGKVVSLESRALRKTMMKMPEEGMVVQGNIPPS